MNDAAAGPRVRGARTPVYRGSMQSGRLLLSRRGEA